jgi:hypothetical protein
VNILDLGVQALTGIFPSSASMEVEAGPLTLVKCHGGEGACHLLQLGQEYSLNAMYGDNYGYRSGLNASMVKHLKAKLEKLETIQKLNPGDTVLDIGSNDGTLLSFYSDSLTRIGIDPTSKKFAKYYQPGIMRVEDFFDAKSFFQASNGKKARRVTSIAMFYDLPDPLGFTKDVAAVLAPDGLWHLEMAYLPMILDRLTYDTVCHEHLEYYGLSQIRWLAERAGLSLVDAEINDVNGGSVAVTLTKAKTDPTPGLLALLEDEKKRGLETLTPYRQFEARVKQHKEQLRNAVLKLRAEGKRLCGLGASTKGNVTLQYCGLGANEIECIAEVNADKFGCFTPGTKIPIVSEADARAKKPDVFLVLPWHFREGIIAREAQFIAGGGRLLFPLPEVALYPS